MAQTLKSQAPFITLTFFCIFYKITFYCIKNIERKSFFFSSIKFKKHLMLYKREEIFHIFWQYGLNFVIDKKISNPKELSNLTLEEGNICCLLDFPAPTCLLWLHWIDSKQFVTPWQTGCGSLVSQTWKFLLPGSLIEMIYSFENQEIIKWFSLLIKGP